MQSNNENTTRPYHPTEELADARSDAKELREAIDAGQRVLDGLESVVASLKSARNWGIWDMIGGGLISTMVKHSKIDDARASVERVQGALRRFQRELADVQAEADIAIEIGSFATFADYFFDGLVADWVVQSRIERSLENVLRLQGQVRRMVRELQTKLDLINHKGH